MKKKVLLAVSLFHSLNDAATITVPMVFPLLYSQQFIIQKYYHIGILSYLGFCMTFIFHLIVANFSDKFDYKYLILISYLGICLSLLSITFTSVFAGFLLIYLIFRAFTSFYHPIGIAWVSKTHPSRGIDFAMGVQSGSGNLGVLIAFISIGYLAQNFNWKVPLITWAVAGFMLGSTSFFLVRKTLTKSEQFIKPDLASWIETLKILKIYIPGFIFGGACWGITVFYAPSLLHHKFKIEMGKTGLNLALWIAIGTVTTYLFGYLSRRFGRLKISLFGFTGTSLFLFVLGTAAEPVQAVIGLLCFGGFLFLTYPALNSYVGNIAPLKNQAQAFSLTANIQVLTAATGNLIAGFLSDKFGINSPFLFLGVIGVFISIFYLSIRSKLYVVS
ncbi:MAG: MFS transporter [Candidatus Aminicenantaceae bacterium]